MNSNKFIEITSKYEGKVIINAACIKAVIVQENETHIYLNQLSTVTALESYDEVKKLIFDVQSQ